MGGCTEVEGAMRKKINGRKQTMVVGMQGNGVGKWAEQSSAGTSPLQHFRSCCCFRRDQNTVALTKHRTREREQDCLKRLRREAEERRGGKVPRGEERKRRRRRRGDEEEPKGSRPAEL